MELSEHVLAIQKKLNSPELLPRFAFRRNSIDYPLVSTVNHIIACLISNNLQPVTSLIDRAKSLIEDCDTNGGNAEYIDLVECYIEEIRKQIS